MHILNAIMLHTIVVKSFQIYILQLLLCTEAFNVPADQKGNS